MMPLVTLWPSGSTARLMEACSGYMAEAGLGPEVYRAIGSHESAPENLAVTVATLHREMLNMNVADPTLHIIVMLPLTEDAMRGWVREAIGVVAPLKYHVTFDILGFQQAAMRVIDPTGAGGKDAGESIELILRAIDCAPFRCSLTVIDDYVASGASASFTLPMLGEFLGIFLEVMGENYSGIFSPALFSSAKDRIMSVGLSRLKFDNDEVTGRLLHRSFVAALEKAGVTEPYVNSQSVAQRAHNTLEGIDGFYDRFFNTYISDELRKNRDEGQLAAALVEPLKREVRDVEQKLTAFIDDKGVSLPEKEATLAMMLGRDNKRLRGNLYKQAVRLFDDVFTRPVALFVDAFNEDAPDSGLLPLRGQYPGIKLPDTLAEDGTILENPLNSRAFNPLSLIKELKSDILDLTAYIRDKEEEIASLQHTLASEHMTGGHLTENELRFAPMIERGVVVAEQPLAESYVPAGGIKPLPSVDLRKNFSPVRDQGTYGACTSFAVTAMYEYAMNLHSASAAPAAMSEGFLYYYSNVASGRGECGSNFFEQLDILSSKGIPPREMYSFESAQKGIEPGGDVGGEARNHRVVRALQIPLADNGSDKYEALRANHKILTQALTEGYPVGVSLRINDSFGAGGAYISRPDGAAETMAGHAMVIVGYSERDKCYIVRNSWGRDFGENGYCYVSASYIDDPDFNNFACIITSTTDDNGSAPRKSVPQLVAPFAGTETQIKIASTRNAVDEAKVRMASAVGKYEDAYRYYRDLLARLELPYVRNELRRYAEQGSAGRVLAMQEKQNRLIDEKPGKLREFCHMYLKKCWTMTLALSASAIVGGLVYYFGGEMGMWWWIAMIVCILLNVGQWLHYRFARRRRDRELKDEIDDCSLRLEHMRRELVEKQLCFHTAGMVVDEFYKLGRRLETLCMRLESFNSNLLCWHEEDSRRASRPDERRATMFMTLTDDALLDALFERNVAEITAGIDLVAAFRNYDLSEHSMQAVRESLESVTRKAIGRLTETFNMEDYLHRTETYPYVAKPDLAKITHRLNHMAQILTRHTDFDSTCESQFLMVKVDNLQAFRSLMNPCFNFPPVVLDASDRNTMVLLSLRTIAPADLVL